MNNNTTLPDLPVPVIPTKPTRSQKIEALIALRMSWTIEDYEEAYGDDFDWKPNRPQTIFEWRQYQYNLMHLSYGEELIDECLENEVFEIVHIR